MFVSPCIQLQTNVTCATYFCHVCGQHVNIWEILQCRDQEHMFQFPFAAITFPPLLCKSTLLCLLFLNSFCIGKHCARKFFFFLRSTFPPHLVRNFVLLYLHGLVDTIHMCAFCQCTYNEIPVFVAVDKHWCTYMCMCSGGFRRIFYCFLVL